MTRITALAVASEISPLVKTGGLADVVGALPLALKAEKVDTITLIPGYSVVLDKMERAETLHRFGDLFAGPARILSASISGLDLFVLDAPHLYVRSGGLYTDADGVDYLDNAFRFAALAKAASLIAQGLLPAFAPDILHAHDWQAGLAPAYLHYSDKPRPATILTIHNLSFQGRFPKELLPALGLPPQSFAMDGVEYYGGVGYLKAGLQLADRITTVSPSYAAEIMTVDGGMGLDGLLRARANVVSGVLNGVDDHVWDPAQDPLIAARYDLRNLAKRKKNKAALRSRLGLADEGDTLLIGVVSRLSWQKGLDLLLEVLPDVVALGAQVALLGAGDKDLESAYASAALAHAGHVGVHLGYDEELAHLIQAGADALLVPSRFEPCGLTQLCALRYGAVPIVARVGGLKDTIIDANEMALSAGVATGLQFSPLTKEELIAAIQCAHTLFKDATAWRKLQIIGMKTDVSWRNPARRYAELYKSLISSRRGDAA